MKEDSLVYKKSGFSFDDIPQFTQRDKAFQKNDSRLKPFSPYLPELNSFDTAIASRNKSEWTDRKLLRSILLEQYSTITDNEKAIAQINKLTDQNTYTVITAHQPSILTGPLYYIYKIASAISVSRQINQKYSDIHVVPIFVIGGEDHDFDEVASLHLFRQTYTWNTNQKGAVGRFSLNGLDQMIEEVTNTFGTLPFASELQDIIQSAFDKSQNYGDFAFRLTHSLFKNHELVIARTDHPELKKKFLPIAQKEIEERFSQTLVQKDQTAIENAGFKSQAHARQVNLFFHDGNRERIIFEDGVFHIGNKKYSLPQLKELLATRPGDISPNVVLRPVFQELIFPNLAYIGGGGELAYWMERKSLFAELGISFPILIRRDSFLIVDKKSGVNLNKAGLSIAQMFDRSEQIAKLYTVNKTHIDMDLNDAREEIHRTFDDLNQKINSIDSTLSQAVQAERAKTMKSIDILENKMIKAEKRKKETEINRLMSIKNKLFPNQNSLQERYDNFIPYFLKYGYQWIDEIIHHADPFDKNFKILLEE